MRLAELFFWRCKSEGAAAAAGESWRAATAGAKRAHRELAAAERSLKHRNAEFDTLLARLEGADKDGIARPASC